MTAAEESRRGGERAGVRRFENKMPIRIDQADILLRIAAPKDEDHRVLPLTKSMNRPRRELLPTAVAVRIRCIRPHRQRRIEQQLPLSGPVLQIPRLARRLSKV